MIVLVYLIVLLRGGVSVPSLHRESTDSLLCREIDISNCLVQGIH